MLLGTTLETRCTPANIGSNAHEKSCILPPQLFIFPVLSDGHFTGMLEHRIEIDWRRLYATFDRVTDGIRVGLRHAMRVCGEHCRKTAKRYANRSPTKAQIDMTLKRKRHTSRRTPPGQLENSIRRKSTLTTFTVYVDPSSPAVTHANCISSM